MADANYPKIPDYRIERLLGTGGMAEVFLAIDEMLNRSVALKITHRALGVDETFARRFVLEARATASLNHPNIVSVYTAKEWEGRSWMAMEYVAGGTLRDRIDGGELSHPEIGRLLSDICAGLEAAHERGYVHRDIKPENILLDSFGKAMVSDFGIVKLTDQSTRLTKLTKTGHIIGSDHYMSPEQILDAPVDRRSDLYSVGVVLYEMLEGQVPYDAAQPVAIHFKHVQEPPPRLADRNARFQKLLNRLLAKQAEERPERATDVAREFAELMSGASGAPATKTSPAAQTETAEAPVSGAPAKPRRTARVNAKDDALPPEMVIVPAGAFQMGDLWGGGDRDEKPVHEVRIAKPFAIGRYPVTFEEYERFTKEFGKKLPDDEGWGKGRRPVINVSWDDAQGYISWLSAQTGKAFRLPGEAEWEYAARSGGKKEQWPGVSDKAKLADHAWYRANSSGRTQPVGGKKGNGLGLHDMAGNVWEWVQDAWHDSYEGAPTDGTAWEGGNSRRRVIRGGSWFNFPDWLRSAYRFRFTPDGRYNALGFRLAQDID